MAAEVTETEAGATGDTGFNASSSGADTPRLVEKVENRPAAPAPAPGEDAPQSGSAPPSETAEGAAPRTPTKTGGPTQEAGTPDNGRKQEPAGVRTSTPVSHSLPSPTAHNGSLLERQESVATTEARLRMEGVELKEEWQDEDFPRPLPEEEEDMQMDEELFTGREGNSATQSYELNSDKKAKKKLMAPYISLTLDRTEGSVLSDEMEESGELDLDDIDTPSDNSNEFEWEGLFPFIAWKQATGQHHVSLPSVHSSKFSQKIKYVFSLVELAELVPMEYVSIPECIKQYEEEKNRKRRKRIDRDMQGKQEPAAPATEQ
nr:PREDICTED: BCL2/adenovirus E1B 19 kDa protein-interacting protein 2 [Lepisosteus oculatus]